MIIRQFIAARARLFFWILMPFHAVVCWLYSICQRHILRVKPTYLYVRAEGSQRVSRLPACPQDSLRLVVMSDTHTRHTDIIVPPCDVLLHCGDISFCGSAHTKAGRQRQLRQFCRWVRQQPCQAAVAVGGNHDTVFLDDLSFLHSDVRNVKTSTFPIEFDNESHALPLCSAFVCLHNACATVTVRGKALKIFGTSSSRLSASSNSAFQLQTKDAETIAQQCARVAHQHGAHVLLAHSAWTDLVQHVRGKVPVLLHGHIHSRFGVREQTPELLSVNAATMNSWCVPTHPVVVLDVAI